MTDPLEEAEEFTAPGVWVKITDTAERRVLVQFPYPLSRPHLTAHPKFSGSEFAADQVTAHWYRASTDLPWKLLAVKARGRLVKHNGHLSGSDLREADYGLEDIAHAPPLLLAIVAEYAPKET